MTPENVATEGEWLPALDIEPSVPQRRLTIAFRIILAIPHLIVLFFLSIATFFVAIVSWFAALALGRLPGWAADFLGDYLAWSTRVSVYMYLLDDRYPPFSMDAPGHSVRIELRPGRLNRLAVLFRFILVIPAAVIAGVISAGWTVCGFVIWLIVLIMGRMPTPLFESTAAVARYQMRQSAYWLMLTSAYPKRLFGDGVPAGERRSATRPLIVSGGGRALLVLFIVLGVLDWIYSGAAQNHTWTTDNSGALPYVVAGH